MRPDSHPPARHDKPDEQRPARMNKPFGSSSPARSNSTCTPFLSPGSGIGYESSTGNDRSNQPAACSVEQRLFRSCCCRWRIDADITGKALRIAVRIFQSMPGAFGENSLLRIHQTRFLSRTAEEIGVKAIDIVEYPRREHNADDPAVRGQPMPPAPRASNA